MSEIVLGVGTSHSPLLAIDASLWAERGKEDLKRESVYLTDGRVISYAALSAEVDDAFAAEASPENFAKQADAAQKHLDRLADAIAEARPDALVIVGDDQEELFDRSHMPAFAIFTGDAVVMYPKNELSPGLPEWYRRANEGYGMDKAHRYPGASSLANFLVEDLIAQGADVAVATSVLDPNQAGFGHAFGFVVERLCKGRSIPIVPVMLNTYYPPNVPTAARCYDLGRMIAKSIQRAPGGQRIVIVASGGLTHFHTDEVFDRRVIDAMAAHDTSTLRGLPAFALRSGNSEILNWVMTAGALENFDVDYCEYIPVRRTPAGTGVGLGFLTWKPGEKRNSVPLEKQS